MFAQLHIPAELVKAAGVTRVTDRQARLEWFVLAKGNLSGILITYPSEDEGRFVTCRICRDRPEVTDGKVKNKYMQPAGGPPLLYRPPGASAKYEILR